jgi:polyisoprenoid-binding protein YceI
MNKTIWFALSSLLWAAQLQAQATPGVGPKTPAAATPMAPAATPAKPISAAPTAPTAAATAAKPAVADKNVDWIFDPGHSTIGFTARHLGFSKVNGMFKKVTATIKADPKTAKISTLDAVVETASIDTGIEKRDQHLRSDDFFAADKYPQLKLSVKTLKWTGNKFTAKAEVTIRDVTKEVPFKGELLGTHMVNFGQGPQQRAGYEATATINRKDFGLKWSAVTEGLAVVGDEVQIDLAAEISYTAPTAPVTAAAPMAAPAMAPAMQAAKPGTPVPAAAKPAAPAMKTASATPAPTK